MSASATPAAGLQAQIDQLEKQLSEASAMERDTDGNPVPIWKGVVLLRDGSGNPKTETVTDGMNTWVRTYTTTGSSRITSGWVKQ